MSKGCGCGGCGTFVFFMVLAGFIWVYVLHGVGLVVLLSCLGAWLAWRVGKRIKAKRDSE